MGSRGIVFSALIVGLLLAASVVLVAWLRRAPPPPVGYAALHRGMTIATAERLLGRPLTFMDTCMGCSYWMEIRDPRYGMVTLVEMETDSRTIDPNTLEVTPIPYGERRIRLIQVLRWSRFDWLNSDSGIASWLVPNDG